jgi:hypothetical protein
MFASLRTVNVEYAEQTSDELLSGAAIRIEDPEIEVSIPV